MIQYLFVSILCFLRIMGGDCKLRNHGIIHYLSCFVSIMGSGTFQFWIISKLLFLTILLSEIFGAFPFVLGPPISKFAKCRHTNGVKSRFVLSHRLKLWSMLLILLSVCMTLTSLLTVYRYYNLWVLGSKTQVAYTWICMGTYTSMMLVGTTLFYLKSSKLRKIVERCCFPTFQTSFSSTLVIDQLGISLIALRVITFVILLFLYMKYILLLVDKTGSITSMDFTPNLILFCNFFCITLILSLWLHIFCHVQTVLLRQIRLKLRQLHVYRRPHCLNKKNSYLTTPKTEDCVEPITQLQKNIRFHMKTQCEINLYFSLPLTTILLVNILMITATLFDTTTLNVISLAHIADLLFQSASLLQILQCPDKVSDEVRSIFCK